MNSLTSENGFAGRGEKDSIGEAILDNASRSIAADLTETGSCKLLDNGSAIESQVRNAGDVAMERAILGIKVGEGEIAAGNEKIEEF